MDKTENPTTVCLNISSALQWSRLSILHTELVEIQILQFR